MYYVPDLYCRVTNHSKTSWVKITIIVYYLSWFLCILDSGSTQLDVSEFFMWLQSGSRWSWNSRGLARHFPLFSQSQGLCIWILCVGYFRLLQSTAAEDVLHSGLGFQRQMSQKREPGKRCINFHHLDSEATQHHFCYILFVKTQSPRPTLFKGQTPPLWRMSKNLLTYFKTTTLYWQQTDN